MRFTWDTKRLIADLVKYTMREREQFPPGPHVIRQTFDNFLLQERDNLLRFAQMITHNNPNAEDILQEALLSVASMFNRPGFELMANGNRLANFADYLDCRDSFRRYVMTAIRHKSIDFYRSTEHRPVTVNGAPVFEVVPDPCDPLDGIEYYDLSDTLAFVAQASEHVRTGYQMILMRLQGYDVKEIADIMGFSEGKVKTNIFRTKAYIKDRLQGIELEYGKRAS